MATNIPPHNLGEVTSALVALLERPRCCRSKRSPEIHVQGPDFPTGGVILNSAADEIQPDLCDGPGLDQAPGHLRARRPDRPNTAFITAIPYGVEKDALVLRIGELIGKGLVPQLTNVKDLSTDDVRIAPRTPPGGQPRRGDGLSVQEHAACSTNFGVNLTCLLPGDGGRGLRAERGST